MRFLPDTHDTAPWMVFSATPLRRYSTSGCQLGIGRAKLGGRCSLKVVIPSVARKRCGLGGAPPVPQVPRYARDDSLLSSPLHQVLVEGCGMGGAVRPPGPSLRSG